MHFNGKPWKPKSLKNQKKSIFNGAVWSIMTREMGLKEFQISLSTDNSSCGWTILEGEKEIAGSSYQPQVHNSGRSVDFFALNNTMLCLMCHSTSPHWTWSPTPLLSAHIQQQQDQPRHPRIYEQLKHIDLLIPSSISITAESENWSLSSIGDRENITLQEPTSQLVLSWAYIQSYRLCIK